MDRRSLLRSVVSMGGASLVSMSASPSAQAADTFHVAVCEQNRNQILIHPAGEGWTPANQVWSWTPPSAIVDGVNTWNGLSDVKFRDTDAFGWVALVTASQGKVGIVNFGDDDALLWSARPYGNPHAVERIPGIGAIVVASSHASDRVDYPGFLTVYAPTDPNDPSTLRRVQEIRFQGAHGIWYDGSHLWALGTWTLAKYRVNGDALSTRLEAAWVHTFSSPFNGHSLDTDYSDSGYLLITGGGSVKRVHKATGVISSMTPSDAGVKSYSRVRSGVSFWQQAIAVTSPPSNGWWNTYIQFFNSSGERTYRRNLEGYGYEGHFYKARVSSTSFS
ncbi:hypothetical protein [Streptomyces sp. NPDC056296]|uniref:hypothetical protein n=1 Tax=Streptomyces sp. NPDC056296 TaxID=3345775 RepID=UPI0035D656AF